jgi:hypothetical protein
MAIVVAEKWGGRRLTRGDGANASIDYVITGTDSDTDATDALDDYLAQNNLRTWDDGIPYQGIAIEQVADQIWFATVNYGYMNNSQNETTNYSFDTGGGTMKITQSHAGFSVNKYAKSGSTAPDFQGAIGVDDNSVNGCDIVVPTYNFSEARYLEAGDVDDTYKMALFNLTGKVNNSSWHGYAQGEVLFLGASGSKNGRNGKWEIAYKFAASPNRTGIQIGSISGIAKKGWEYLWVRYEKSVNQDVLVQTPAAVYVHQVYEYGDFSNLGF